MAAIRLEHFSTPPLFRSAPQLVYVNIHKVNALKMCFPRICVPCLCRTVPLSAAHCSMKPRELVSSLVA
jgi:hypothetical protein